MYYDAALRDINNPSSGYYIPYPTADMSCDDLVSWTTSLKSQIALWNSRLVGNTNYTEIGNINSILEIQNDKLSQYNNEYQRCTLTTVSPTTGEPVAEVTTQTTEGTGTSGILIALLILAGGIWFLSRKKKRHA